MVVITLAARLSAVEASLMNFACTSEQRYLKKSSSPQCEMRSNMSVRISSMMLCETRTRRYELRYCEPPFKAATPIRAAGARTATIGSCW